MLYGALRYDNSCNLGDNIQTIAAIQYLPSLDFWVDRDSGTTDLKDDGSKGIVIYNGWFNLSYWRFIPPNITAIFESFHLQLDDHRNEKIYDCLKQYIITPNLNLIEALRSSRYPVGCRDTRTYITLSTLHVPCRYSGCLTLTLNKRNVLKHNEIVVIDVDPLIPWINELKHIRVRSQVTNFTDKEVLNKLSVNEVLTNETKLKQAQELLDEIEGSKLVITSRLHSALPAIAFEVPVIFVTGTFDIRLCDYLKYIPTSDGTSCPVDIESFTWEKMITDYNVSILTEKAKTLKSDLVKLISTQ